MEPVFDFSEFCASLNANRVEYLVVGAHAMAFHGVPRYTGDFDVYVNGTVENGERVLAAIRAFGFPTGELTAHDVANPRRIIQMGIRPAQIHVMSEISGIAWTQAWAGREGGHVGDVAVQFLGLVEFVQNKRASGRLKDLADLEALGRSGEPE